MANETKWTPAHLILRPLGIGDSLGIYIANTEDPGRAEDYLGHIQVWKVVGVESIRREDAKQYADLLAASPELLEALEPDDRLNAGAIIHTGYKSKSSVETMHLLHCYLDRIYHHPMCFDKDMAAKVQGEIERLMDRAEKALEKARRGQDDSTPEAPRTRSELRQRYLDLGAKKHEIEKQMEALLVELRDAPLPVGESPDAPR
jgi:hypothetical protein